MNKHEKVSLDFVALSNDPWGFYRNHCVEAKVHDLRVGGIYRGMTTWGKLILAPHISFSPNFNNKSVPQICDNPAILSADAVMGMFPQNYEVMVKNVEQERRRLLGEEAVDYSI